VEEPRRRSGGETVLDEVEASRNMTVFLVWNGW
jgi:hypothetical protein